MSIRTIVLHPDPRLRRAAEEADAADPAIAKLIEDMFDTMYHAPGIGLAAPQLGVSRRVIVMDCAGRDGDEAEPPDPIALINPELVWTSEETSTYNEGCLSLPEQFEDVVRPAQARVRWTAPDGAEQERQFVGVRATCVQHEIDHLDGKLFIDHIGPVKRTMITQKMKKLKRERAKERAAARG